MTRREELTERLLAQRLVAIIRTSAADAAMGAARSAIEAGVRCLEITMTTPGALDVVAELRTGYPAAVIGAGTVLDAAAAAAAVTRGAQFLVSPHLGLDVIASSLAHDVPVFPGCATVTEIVTAMRAGAPVVKIFPAAVLGPRFIRDVLAPLPNARMIPTGGVRIESAPDWIAAGAVAVGIGSALTEGGPEEVAARVKALLAALA